MRAYPIEISDIEGELDRTLGIRTPGLIFAKIDNNFKEEEEGMSLNPRKGLKDLLVGRNKGSSSKEAPKSQPPSSLPPLVTSLLLIPNLKKKMKEQEVEEGEVVRQETKKQKMAQDKGRATSVESREDPGVAEVS